MIGNLRSNLSFGTSNYKQFVEDSKGIKKGNIIMAETPKGTKYYTVEKVVNPKDPKNTNVDIYVKKVKKLEDIEKRSDGEVSFSIIA